LWTHSTQMRGIRSSPAGDGRAIESPVGTDWNLNKRRLRAALVDLAKAEHDILTTGSGLCEVFRARRIEYQHRCLPGRRAHKTPAWRPGHWSPIGVIFGRLEWARNPDHDNKRPNAISGGAVLQIRTRNRVVPTRWRPRPNFKADRQRMWRTPRRGTVFQKRLVQLSNVLRCANCELRLVSDPQLVRAVGNGSFSLFVAGHAKKSWANWTGGRLGIDRMARHRSETIAAGRGGMI